MRGLLWVLSTLFFASAQTRGIAPEEVRISSGSLLRSRRVGR
jgi:hypothetical protein